MSNGWNSSCIVQNGGLRCWPYRAQYESEGAQNNALRGTLSTFVKGLTPGSGVTDVATGNDFTCIVQNGGVRCGGDEPGLIFQWKDHAGEDYVVSKYVFRDWPDDIKTYQKSFTYPSTAGDIDIFAMKDWLDGKKGHALCPDRFQITDTSERIYLQGPTDGSTLVETTIRKPAGITALTVTVTINPGDDTKNCDYYSWSVRLSPLFEDQKKAPPRGELSGFLPLMEANSGVTRVVAAKWSACAVQGGGVRCFGTYDDPTTYISDLAPGAGVTDLAVANKYITLDIPAIPDYGPLEKPYVFFCAIVKGGLRCWGQDPSGGVKDGSTSQYVDGLNEGSGVTAVAVNETHACAVVSGGVLCSTPKNPLVFDQVPYGMEFDTAVSAISMDENTTCAIQDGEVHCWGNGEDGDLGSGSYVNAVVPMEVQKVEPEVNCAACLYDVKVEKECKEYRLPSPPLVWAQFNDLNLMSQKTGKFRLWCVHAFGELYDNSHPINKWLSPDKIDLPASKFRAKCKMRKKAIPNLYIWSEKDTGGVPTIPVNSLNGMIEDQKCTSISLEAYAHSSESYFDTLAKDFVTAVKAKKVTVPLTLNHIGCASLESFAADLIYDAPGPPEMRNQGIKRLLQLSEDYGAPITIIANQMIAMIVDPTSSFESKINSKSLEAYTQTPVKLSFFRGKITLVEALYPCPTIASERHSTLGGRVELLCHRDELKGDTWTTSIIRMTPEKSEDPTTNPNNLWNSTYNPKRLDLTHVMQTNNYGDRRLDVSKLNYK